jgi:hypothetical protein
MTFSADGSLLVCADAGGGVVCVSGVSGGSKRRKTGSDDSSVSPSSCDLREVDVKVSSVVLPILHSRTSSSSPSSSGGGSAPAVTRMCVCVCVCVLIAGS